MRTAPSEKTKKASEILIFLCLNDRGGAELSMLKIAQGLVERGYTVTLAVYGAHPEWTHERGFTGKVIDLATRRSLGAMMPLVRLLRSGRYAALLTAFTHSNIIALGAACLSGHAVRVIVTEHGVDGLTACEKSRFFALLTRGTYGRAAAVVAVSQGLAERWRHVVAARTPVATIYNPVVGDGRVKGASAHAWLAAPKPVPVIFGIGRLKVEKNFALLIRAFAGLVAGREARLILLGEGEQRVMLERLVREWGLRDKVLMPGFVDDPEVWLASADVLVCPSQREGFGNVIVEALALGVPVVATDCPYGPAEILDDGRYGRLVPMEDATAMTRAIAEALDTPCDRNLLVTRAKDFSVASCIDQYAKLIDTLPHSYMDTETARG